MSHKAKLILGCIALATIYVVLAYPAGGIIWRTGGNELAQGNSFNVTVEKKAGYANFRLSTNALTVTCTEEISAGGPEIIGGDPGRTGGVMELRSCTAPAMCEVQGEVEKVPGRLGAMGFAGALREGEQAPGVFKVVALVSLSAGIEFINKPGEVCPLRAGNPYRLSGFTLVEINPVLMEATELKFIYQTGITMYKIPGLACTVVAELKLNNEVAHLTGEAGVFENVLPPRSFGAF